MAKTFSDFTQNFALLNQNGEIKIFEGGEAFWGMPPEKFEEIGESWLITEFDFVEDWQTWEMHPNGEEIVYLLSGEMDLTLENDGGLQTIELRSKGAVVIPPNTWHTAKVLKPSKMLVFTLGKDTQVKPV